MTSAFLSFLSWYLASSMIGALALPLAWRALGRLPDRGYGFIRAIGLLFVGYTVWMGATTGLLRNTFAGCAGASLLLAAVGALSLRGRWQEFRDWLRGRRRMIVVMELLFLLAFAAWAFVRSNSPGIFATEKPMELAFLNALATSPTFPPPDPWLSGFAISYYYFGFVLSNILKTLTGVTTGVSFNLTSAMWFGLTTVGCYSLVYDLIKNRHPQASLAAPLLGPLFVVVSGNLEGFLELLHARGLFWRSAADGSMTSAFWRWLDIKELVNPPFGPPVWIPTRNWWWWRASRVVRDLNVAGIDHEVIDEFPFFSFLLADNHPHVLALPFVLLALAVCFHLYLAGKRGLATGWLSLAEGRFRSIWIGLSALSAVLVGGIQLVRILAPGGPPIDPAQAAIQTAGTVVVAMAATTFLWFMAAGRMPSLLGPVPLSLAAWLFGGLAFLNAWDFPIYLSLLLLVLLLSARQLGWVEAIKAAASTAVGLGLLGVLFYLPWYPTFSSQAGGVLPNLAFPTKIQQFVVMFGTLAVPLTVWLIRRIRDERSWAGRQFVLVAVGLPLLLFMFSWLLAGVIGGARGPEAIGAALKQIGVDTSEAGVRTALGRRLLHPWTALLLGGGVAAVWLLVRRPPQPIKRSEGHPDAVPTWPFAALLVGVGGLLVLGPEFVYLKDFFGTRMNTIFKFYYAAWLLWGVAAAYATYDLWPRMGESGVARLQALIVLPLAIGLFYPVMSLTTRTQGFSPPAGRTLDGTAYLQRDDPADAQAIDWLNDHELTGVVAEAVGGSYSQYARIATHTGLTTVLGWEFHEVQWRGSVDPQGTRNADIESLFRSRSWPQARQVLERYGIDYVYVGPLERSTYGIVRTNLFNAFMTPIYDQGDVVIYQRIDQGRVP